MPRKEKYEELKKRIGKHCYDCGGLLCPNNKSGLCRSCSMSMAVLKRLGNKKELREDHLKVIKKIKKGYHKFEDIELIELWERGHSDGFIAKMLGVSTSVVCSRRYKLLLVANFKPFFGDNLDEEQMKEREEGRQEEIKELRSRYEDDPHYYNKKKYKNSLKNHGRKNINAKYMEDYKKRKRKLKLRCDDCNNILAPRNKKGLCISCCQKSFSDSEFYELYKKGLNDYKIAKILKVHPPAVCRRRKKLKLMPYYSIKFTNEEFLKLYKQGLNNTQIARVLGLKSSGSISNRRKKLWLPNHFNLKREVLKQKNEIPQIIQISK